MISANSIDSVAGFEKFVEMLPQNDSTFDAGDAIAKYDKIGFFVDGTPCGLLLCLVVIVGGRRIFFISALAVSTQVDGADIYKWVENKAREMDCEKLVFESPRKGMLWNARRYGWRISNVKYEKDL